MSVAHLDLADLVAIAELVLQDPGEDIAWVARLDLAESALHAPAAFSTVSSSAHGEEVTVLWLADKGSQPR